MKPTRLFAFTLGLLLACSTLASAEILALLAPRLGQGAPAQTKLEWLAGKGL